MKALRNNPVKAQPSKKLSKNSGMMKAKKGDLNDLAKRGATAYGKGDADRVEDKEAFGANYDGINWNSKKGVA